MNLNYQTVMRSCYKLGKILPNGRWEQTSPEGRRIWKAKLSERGTKCREEKVSLYYMLVAFIRPQSLPSAVFRSIGLYVDRMAVCSIPGGGGGAPHTLPTRVVAAQQGRDFEAPDLQRGIKNCGSLLYHLLMIVADYEEAFL